MKLNTIKVLFLCSLLNLATYAQTTNLTNNSTALPEFVGWSNLGTTPKHLDIRNQWGAAFNVRFFTNGSPGNERGTILGTNGFWGIGNTGAFIPNQLLTVNAGNTNVQNITTGIHNNGYMLGNVMSLWRGSAGNINNIFTGANAGFFNTSGSFNTFNGTQSGQANNTGSNNTFMGWRSGFTNDGASNNTFLGFRCGIANTGAGGGGFQNTFTGSQSGQGNTVGRANTFMGFESGFSNLDGDTNIYIGWQTARLGNNTQNRGNIMIGERAGFNNIDKHHIFIGTRAGFSQNAPGVVGNVYIGYHSGRSGIIAGENCFVGYRTGILNLQSGNTFLGFACGTQNISGFSNSFLGAGAGNGNVDGDLNTLLGSGANTMTPNQNNSAAIGSGCITPGSDKMILGNNNVNVGIGLSADNIQFGPQQKLEIDAGLSGFNPEPSGNPGASGMRFRDLHLGNTPSLPNGVVLTVNAFGDVILVPDGSGFYPCNPLTPITQDDLPSDSWWQLNTFNFVFNGNGNGNNQDNVGVGTTCTPGAKLDVFQNSLVAGAIGIRSIIPFLGVAGTPNIAGWFEAVSGAFPNHAIIVPPNGGLVGIGTTTPNPSYLLTVMGDAFINNTVVPSDSRYKMNIVPMSSALDKIRNINAVYFHFDTLAWPGRKFNSSRQIGFIAQNIDSVLPEAVTLDDSGYYALNYEKVVPLLMRGMQEQQAQIDSLMSINARFSNSQNLPSQNVILASKNCMLFQNTPNPFGESTSISYYLPDATANAEIVFYDMYGKELQRVQLEHKGKAKIDLTTKDLASGIYSYTLFADGRVIDTLKMVRVK